MLWQSACQHLRLCQCPATHCTFFSTTVSSRPKASAICMRGVASDIVRVLGSGYAIRLLTCNADQAMPTLCTMKRTLLS